MSGSWITFNGKFLFMHKKICTYYLLETVLLLIFIYSVNSKSWKLVVMKYMVHIKYVVDKTMSISFDKKLVLNCLDTIIWMPTFWNLLKYVYNREHLVLTNIKAKRVEIQILKFSFAIEIEFFRKWWEGVLKHLEIGVFNCCNWLQNIGASLKSIA